MISQDPLAVNCGYRAGSVDRVLLVGCGDPGKLNAAQSKKVSEALSRALVASPAKDAQILMECLTRKLKNPAALMEQMSLSLSLAHYQYGQTLNKRKKPERALKKVAILPGALCGLAAARRAVLAGVATGQGANLTRQLVNLPGNICTPKFLASEARRLARSDKNLTTTIVNERKMAELGMHSLLSVGNGSEQPSQLIIIKYRGAASSARPYCLVGKGITFDTGGISLKPGAKMDEMKFDMGGAGSVFGAIKAASRMKLPSTSWASSRPQKTCRVDERPSPAMWSQACQAKRSKFSIPTPRVVWCCATHSPMWRDFLPSRSLISLL